MMGSDSFRSTLRLALFAGQELTFLLEFTFLLLRASCVLSGLIDSGDSEKKKFFVALVKYFCTKVAINKPLLDWYLGWHKSCSIS